MYTVHTSITKSSSETHKSVGNTALASCMYLILYPYTCKREVHRALQVFFRTSMLLLRILVIFKQHKCSLNSIHWSFISKQSSFNQRICTLITTYNFLSHDFGGIR